MSKQRIIINENTSFHHYYPYNNWLMNFLHNKTVEFESIPSNINQWLYQEIFSNKNIKKVFSSNNLIDDLLLKNPDEINNLEFGSEYILWRNQTIKLINSKWNKLSFNNYPRKNTSLEISWAGTIKKIEFKNCSNASNIRINLPEEKINKLSFINFQTEQSLDVSIKEIERFEIRRSYFESRKISFTNINASNIFSITDSSLGQISLNWLIINTLFLKNSDISSVLFNAVKFPAGNLLLKTDDRRKKNLSAEILKDNYRQLKFAMDNNGNFTDANKFFSNEMRSHVKSLDTKYISWKNLRDLYKSNFLWKDAKELWEFISLSFSSNVNDFWNNWLRPLFLLFFASFAATIIDGSAAFFWELIISIFILILLVIEFKIWFFSRPQKVIDYMIDNFWFFLFFIVLSLLFLHVFISDFNSLKTLSLYINPIWFLPEYEVINTKRYFITYSWIELFWFTIYKIFYWIILWHLIVAAKRTTKR